MELLYHIFWEKSSFNFYADLKFTLKILLYTDLNFTFKNFTLYGFIARGWGFLCKMHSFYPEDTPPIVQSDESVAFVKKLEKKY